MSKFAASLAVAAVLLSASAIAETAKPTVVLVHGAFADSSSWNGVTRILQKDGYNVVAAANPLVSAEEAALMAAGQRPITEAALTEKSGAPAWKKLPSYFIYGDGDKNIPAQGLRFMAERAGSKHTVVIKGASHVVMVSHPQDVATLIEEAAK
ncbi:alpha/beta fold hydrolase [Enterobacter sp. ZOR0014]|uniref:alpha/beta fold hydrolase n=1 Tax=Enterobacter sp. ZOR0014 TaxID=1339232 RepID=UPI000646CD4D|nr:alpha/beta hydrolase [Enterobacter sp. ZOR0014]